MNSTAPGRAFDPAIAGTAELAVWVSRRHNSVGIVRVFCASAMDAPARPDITAAYGRVRWGGARLEERRSAKARIARQ